MTDWQPIETAPRDGTDVIVGFDRADTWIVHVAWWRTGEEYGCTANDRGWWSYTLGSVTQEQLDEDRTPTHWMPLPDPPVSISGGK